MNPFGAAAIACLGAATACSDGAPAASSAGAPSDAGMVCTGCGDCEEYRPAATRAHDDGPIDYPDSPPAGGSHSSCWAEWGEHTTPVPPSRWLHNLEHGGLVLLYDCPAGCEAEVTVLRDFVSEYERTLLTAYPGLGVRFAIVAWEHRLVSDCLDQDTIRAFHAAHFDRAPESVAGGPGPGCMP